MCIRDRTAQRDPDTQEPKQRDLYRVGTIAMIKQVIRLPKNIFRVLVEGIGRAELLELNADQEFLQAEVALLEDHSAEHLDERSREAMLRTIKEIFGEYAAANTKMSKELTAQMMELVELDRLVDQIAINIPLYYEEKQKILEAAQLYDRYELLCVMLSNEVEIMHIKAELQTKVKERVDKNQREYLLREQLKLIREELGEDNTFTDADHFMEELNKLEALSLIHI